ncbi:tRNA pseudouridine(55) synthase TruB [Caldimonas thermodepolymerans]|uniref:tRNA pseudouridine synthase B n=1 Tax=Caldimonas thermodepolymerans TaxID=215580 RepID=A0A2S5T7B2_9BURK|nr:tRNA pseudouridine(55) synthase TruB [Caldimonas thermodepolymerans]PPE70893.1 tRNA pseudouridine(55) synthase TruB [Caldimonas thermodepolymerans]QPC33117.1 tRNA pseudouridine(55) synthase TruB [Caldimonas thermodepolymerans]RDI03905.1 tRNA pseudouridine synthase B [Caldimonas thermodepolymerans]
MDATTTTAQGTRPRLPRRAVHGVLLLDKPLGLSSNDALQKARRLYRAEKAGHTGTLDPLATGLLPLCFGAATKFSQVSLEADKTYRARLRLGVRTTTGDAEGEVLAERPVQVTREQVLTACARFTGEIDQVPPMYSALKRDGKALYEYARAGIEVEREPRRVTIHRIDVLDFRGDEVEIEVRCSKGTYVRTLAEDIGEALGCGAHLVALRRTGTGPLTLEGAVTLEQLEAMDEAGRDRLLRPVDELLADWPVVRLEAEDAGRFLSGMRRRVALPDAPQVRVYGPQPGAFLGSARIRGGELISTRLLSPLEVEGLLNAQASKHRHPS